MSSAGVARLAAPRRGFTQDCDIATRLVQGAGFRVQGLGFRVQGPGFRVQGSGFRVQGSGFRVRGSGYKVQGSGFRDRVAGCRLRVGGCGLRVSGFGFEPSFRVYVLVPGFQSSGSGTWGPTPGFRVQGVGFKPGVSHPICACTLHEHQSSAWRYEHTNMR